MLIFAIGGWERGILVVLAGLTLALAFVLLWLLRRVERMVRHVDSVFVWQHKRRTPVATIAGLVSALEQGLEQGGLTPDQRRAIYRAIDEQLALFYSLDEASPLADDEDGDGPDGTPATAKYRPGDSGVQQGGPVFAWPR